MTVSLWGDGQHGAWRKRRVCAFQLFPVIPSGTLSHASCALGRASPVLSADPFWGVPDSDGFGPLLLPFPSLPQAPCNSAQPGRALLCTKPQ